AALHVPHPGHGHGNGGADAHKSDDADETGTPNAEGTQRAVEGIPTENPQHHPADGDGTCDKGETIVKTTPSGVAVNVPCQAAEDHGQNNADKTHEPEDNADETRGPDETPGAKATEHAAEHGDHTPVPLPTQANPHASEG